MSSDRRDRRDDLPEVHERRPEPDVLLEELDVVHANGAAVFVGEDDGERIRSDAYLYLDGTR